MKRVSLILILISLLFLMVGNEEVRAQQATLSIDPSTQTAAANSTFQVQVKVNTGSQSINTVSANLTYDSNIITAQSIDTTGSFITIWFENLINAPSQVIRLSGSIPSPGVNGDNLHLATITFVANSVATTQIQFDDDSAVFRDSDNTNILILGQSTGGIVTVSANLTPEASGIPTTTPQTTPEVTSVTTPTGLPDAGTTLPTYILILIVIVLAIGAAALLM